MAGELSCPNSKAVMALLSSTIVVLLQPHVNLFDLEAASLSRCKAAFCNGTSLARSVLLLLL